jgi:RCC1 and BTB domain-containing protein
MSVVEIARGDEGALYACGGNDSGQLCLRDMGESRTLCFIPPSVVGPVVYVAAGCSHTYVISSSTAVFGCGSNDRGQLAVAEAEDSAPSRAYWMQCSSFARLKITQVACGESHTMALTADGEVFAWGAGDGGRLGLGDVRSRVVPAQITFFRRRSSLDDDGSAGTVGSISCGYHHSMAVTGKCSPTVPPTTTTASLMHTHVAVDGHVYAWGSGLSGQLGNGLQDSRVVPTRMMVEGGKPLKAFAARGGE